MFAIAGCGAQGLSAYRCGVTQSATIERDRAEIEKLHSPSPGGIRIHWTTNQNFMTIHRPRRDLGFELDSSAPAICRTISWSSRSSRPE